MNANSFHPARAIPELLSPAGSYDALKSAVANGADAVYLGLKANNARMGAENFDFDILKDAVSYAHSYGVKVFLTLNTLLPTSGLDYACENALQAASLGVDSLICQDMGLASRLLNHRKAHPADLPLEIHASTQMSIYNIGGLKLLKEMGFDRCITARELRLSELEEMCRANIMDIEFFCHGALCISISGQCLLSAYLSGAIEGSPLSDADSLSARSGNKGTCAGPCRLKYGFIPDKFSQGKPVYNYKLSPSDISTLSYLDDVIRTGVRSLKIEGRLKSPEYVAYVTRQYRNALDNYVKHGNCHPDKNDCMASVSNMQLLFGRDKFISGNHLGMMNQDAITLDYPGRKGLFIGTMDSAPVKLPRPASMPKNLTQFKITIKSNSCLLKNGDGVTVLKGIPVAGGSINKVENTGYNTYCLTIAGNIEDGRFFTDRFVGSPVFQTYSSELYDEIRTLTKNGYERRKNVVTAEFVARVGLKPVLKYIYVDASGKESIASVTGEKEVQPAVASPLCRDDIARELTKLGNTPYECTDAAIDMDDNIFMPVSAIKSLRREAISRLDAMLRQGNNHTADVVTKPSSRINSSAALPATSLYFYNSDDFLKMNFGKLAKPVIIYLPMEAFSRISSGMMFRQKMDTLPCGSLLIAYFPYINIGNNLKSIYNLLENSSVFTDGYMLANPGDYKIFEEFVNSDKSEKSFILTADNSFNVCNRDALDFYHNLEISSVTLSPEMTSGEVLECMNSRLFTDKKYAEYIVSGPITLMRMRYCLLSDGKCRQCKKMPSGSLVRKLSDISSKIFTVKSLGNDCHNILLSEAIKRPGISHPGIITRYNILAASEK